MELLIDTNVLLDVIFGRRECKIAQKMFETMEKQRHKACITASSVTDLFYIIHKETHDIEKTYFIMENIFRLVSVLSVSAGDIKQAFQKKWTDFEDCVQVIVAKNNELDGIITGNKKDFSRSPLPVWSPAEYLQNYS